MPTTPWGPVFQCGFVVEDWRAAALHWAEQLGVGPFFVLEHIPFETCYFRGQPADIDMSVAIAYSGEQQIELVQQFNDTPSIYTDYLELHPPGLQHMGTLVEDLEQVLSEPDLEAQVIQHGRTSAGHNFAYLETGGHAGTMVELIEANDAMHRAFDHMRQAARDWDGKDPIRG